MSWQAALAGAAVCAVGGWLTPYLIRILPEPVPDPEAPDDEPAKVAYADLGRRPRLPAGCAAVSALAGGVLGGVLGWDWLLVLVLPLVPIGVLLSVVDWTTRLLPKVVVLPATGYAVGYGLVGWLATGASEEAVHGLIGLLATRTFFWLLWFVRRAGMGFGDVRLAGLLGGVLGYAGWSALVVGLYSSFLLFAVPFLILAIVRRDRSMVRRAYPFGPFLLGGALVGLVVGEQVARASGY